MHSQAGLPQDVSPFDAALSGPVGPGAILHSNGSAEKTGCLSSYLCALNERLESPQKKFRPTLSSCTFDPTFRGLLAVGARWSIFRADHLLFWECCWTMLGRVELFSCAFEGLGAVRTVCVFAALVGGWTGITTLHRRFSAMVQNRAGRPC